MATLPSEIQWIHVFTDAPGPTSKALYPCHILIRNQRWEVTKYFVLVLVLYIPIYFPDFVLSPLKFFYPNICTLYFLHFQIRLVTFLLVLICIWWHNKYNLLSLHARLFSFKHNKRKLYEATMEQGRIKQECLMLWMKQRELAMST